MDGPPLYPRRRRLAVDGIAKDIKHPGENRFADWCAQWPPRILHRHAAGKTLGGRQRNPTDVACTSLREHLDDNSPFPSSAKH